MPAESKHHHSAPPVFRVLATSVETHGGEVRCTVRVHHDQRITLTLPPQLAADTATAMAASARTARRLKTAAENHALRASSGAPLPKPSGRLL